MSSPINRRQFLRQSLAASSTAAIASTGLSGCQKTGAQTQALGQNGSLSFQELPHRLDHQHHIPEGYQAQVLLSWGDALDAGENLDFSNPSAERQAQCFGFNNDFIGFFPLDKNAKRGLLCVNHEYTQPHLMFSGYTSEQAGDQNTLPEHIEIEQQASGHSVVEIALNDQGLWQLIDQSPYNRRISVTTPMSIVGEAAGHKRLQTLADPTGRLVLGTLGNCAGGKTPWGTVLIAEEGIANAFYGNPEQAGTEADNYSRLNVGTQDRHWGLHQARFNIDQEPNELNRFGWMIELDPYNPGSQPRKLTGLGRFEHEGTTLVCKPNQKLTAYTGDDDEFQFIYRFVSNDIYQADNQAANRDLLVNGTLYVAKLDNDGSGRWLPMVFGQGPLTPDNGFNSQADVLIECRRAGELLDATKMDRPEDIETNPVNDCTYVMLTKNKKRTEQDPANLRSKNEAGHILELVPPGTDGNRDHTSPTFTWNSFLLGGDPKATDKNKKGHYGWGANAGKVSDSGWFCNPDNLAFDDLGNLWAATDGCEDFGFGDGLWAMATTGPKRALPKHFLTCPSGAELCGPEFSPDGETLFVAVQHPADVDGSNFDNPAHRWPEDGGEKPPRPSILAIRKVGGGRVGS